MTSQNWTIILLHTLGKVQPQTDPLTFGTLGFCIPVTEPVNYLTI